MNERSMMQHIALSFFVFRNNQFTDMPSLYFLGFKMSKHVPIKHTIANPYYILKFSRSMCQTLHIGILHQSPVYICIA